MIGLYVCLQRIALVPLALFFWSGLADELLGWPGVLPFGLGAAQTPSAVAVAGTWIEILAPMGLLFARTCSTAALVLSGYAMTLAVAFHPFWRGDGATHHVLQSFLLSATISGVLAFVFAAARLQQREQLRRAGDRPVFAVSPQDPKPWPVARPPARTTLVAADPRANWMRTQIRTPS